MRQGTGVQQAPPPPGFSAQEMLTSKREELRAQLKELSTRRNQLQEQRAVTSTGAQAKEIEARISVIDTRTSQLEQQLFSVNDQITSGLTVGQQSSGSLLEPQIDAALLARQRARDMSRQSAAAAIFAVFALYGLWRAARFFFWKRKPALPENSAQLSQLQQSIDVIALEVERISEAQRYAAKIMNERGLGAGEAQPVGSPKRESAEARNRV